MPENKPYPRILSGEQPHRVTRLKAPLLLVARVHPFGIHSAILKEKSKTVIQEIGPATTIIYGVMI